MFRRLTKTSFAVALGKMSLLILTAALPVFAAPVADSAEAPKKVLIFSGTDPNLPGVVLVTQLLRSTLEKRWRGVEHGGFREDLWYRLNVFPITVPPLRDRKDDIPGLVKHFVKLFSQKLGRGISAISPGSLRVLQDYAWPGNVRELANVIERAVINTSGTVLRIVDHFEKPNVEEPTQTDKTLDEIEKEYIVRILRNTGWRINGHRGAARILGLNPSTLRTRMTKLGIQKPEGNVLASVG